MSTFSQISFAFALAGKPSGVKPFFRSNPTWKSAFHRRRQMCIYLSNIYTSMPKTRKPCKPDQIRSKTTGRCIKECAPGKVRSETTNRCGKNTLKLKPKLDTPTKATANAPPKRDWHTSTPVSGKTIRRMQTMLNTQLAKRKVPKNEKYISVFNQYRPGPNSPLLPPV